MSIRSAALASFVACSGAIALAAASTLSTALAQQPAPTPMDLKAPSEFESIGDRTARSQALFTELGKVLTHPRCMNCHPAGASPTQNDDRHLHMPPVFREDADAGTIGTTCAGCHSSENFAVSGASTYKSVPGHARWGFAPLSMAWQGRSLGDICRQLKDKDRNGGRDLAMLQEHIAKDDLVAWGWKPGPGRVPAPGNQETAGKLAQAWIDTGAACPEFAPEIRPQ